jgi:hypothetical protein
VAAYPDDHRLKQSELDDALRKTRDLLAPFDDRAKTLLTPLLTTPLKVGPKP